MIDSRGCDARRLFDGYQAFGLLCARQKVRAALVRTGDEDADGHYTLRDILVTLARVAGTPVRFRLAFVAGCDAIARVCRAMENELTPLGCEVRVFQNEREAHDWLHGGRPRVHRAQVHTAPALQ